MKPPIFIIGNPRSGTTLFRLMLTSHPAIVIPPECGFAIWWQKKYHDWTADCAASARAGEFIADLFSSKKIETWNLESKNLLAQIQAVRPNDYSALVSLVYEFYAASHKPGFQRWGDKNNFHIRHIPDLHALFPQAQFLHITRDGRDVACSYRQLGEAKITSAYAPKLARDITVIAEEWKSNLEAVDAAFQSLPVAQKMEIRYEDLVQQTEKTLRAVCAFLGEPYDSQMLNYHQLNREHALEPAEFLQWKAKTLEAPDASALGKFRTQLTAEEISAFENVAADQLRKHLYL